MKKARSSETISPQAIKALLRKMDPAHAAKVTGNDVSSVLRQIDELATSNISLVSHTHGRERRLERDIDRRELQAAVKHSKPTAANPGRDGDSRLKFVYNGVVYITDKTGKHEVTSWRLDENDNVVPHAQLLPCEYMTHTVLVVDHSGSMRKEDVDGSTRTAAVYTALTDQFIAPSLEAQRAQMALAGASSASVGASDLSGNQQRKPQVGTRLSAFFLRDVVFGPSPGWASPAVPSSTPLLLGLSLAQVVSLIEMSNEAKVGSSRAHAPPAGPLPHPLNHPSPWASPSPTEPPLPLGLSLAH